MRLLNSSATNSLIDLSNNEALGPLARLLNAVREAADPTPILLVGAAARDLLLVHVHGIDPERATEDTDVALAIPDWTVFVQIRKILVQSKGFTADPRVQHRVWLGANRVDLIPFGGVERADRSIAWPPDGDVVMNVSGFTEALETAEAVRLPGGLEMAVVSLPALALLKVWAWKDRHYTGQGKDASDLWTLLHCYAEAGNEDRLYGSEVKVLTTSGFDLEIAGAWLLGRDAREALNSGSEPHEMVRSLRGILEPELDAAGPLRLIGQMPSGDHDRAFLLLKAFHFGLTERQFEL